MGAAYILLVGQIDFNRYICNHKIYNYKIISISENSIPSNFAGLYDAGNERLRGGTQGAGQPMRHAHPHAYRPLRPGGSHPGPQRRRRLLSDQAL